MRSLKITVFLLALFPFMLSAQQTDFSGEPGYINFDEFSELKSADLVTEVMIENNLLKMVAKLAENEDPELAALLNGLKLVRVHEFAAKAGDQNQYKTSFEKIDKELNSKGWDRIVMSKSQEEYANVYIKTTGESRIDGLVVTSYEFGGNEGEVVFVNIVGNIDLDTIGKLSSKFNIPHINDVNKNNGNKK